MDIYKKIYEDYMESPDSLEPEDILKLMQYLSKEKNCEFNVKFCGHLPVVDIEGYTVDVIREPEGLIISVSTAVLQSTVMLALAKLRNILLEENNDGNEQAMEV